MMRLTFVLLIAVLLIQCQHQSVAEVSDDQELTMDLDDLAPEIYLDDSEDVLNYKRFKRQTRTAFYDIPISYYNEDPEHICCARCGNLGCDKCNLKWDLQDPRKGFWHYHYLCDCWKC